MPVSRIIEEVAAGSKCADRRAGGFSPAPCVINVMGMYPSGMPPLEMSFNSPDLNRDLAVSLIDVALFSASCNASYSFVADLQADGHVNLVDITILARPMGAHCP